MSKEFSERLKAARDLRNLSQSDLAAKAELPPSSISHFEAGARKPSFDNLRRLALALEVTTDYLLGLVDKPELSAEADPLYRDSQNLTDQDREMARRFLRMLSENKQKSSGEE